MEDQLLPLLTAAHSSAINHRISQSLSRCLRPPQQATSTSSSPRPDRRTRRRSPDSTFPKRSNPPGKSPSPLQPRKDRFYAGIVCGNSTAADDYNHKLTERLFPHAQIDWRGVLIAFARVGGTVKLTVIKFVKHRYKLKVDVARERQSISRRRDVERQGPK